MSISSTDSWGRAELPQPLRELCQVAAHRQQQPRAAPLALEAQLVRYFGQKEFDALLVQVVRSELHLPEPSAAREPLVLIPDFMGSELHVDGQPFWLNLRAIMQGLDKLKVYHEVDLGKETRPHPLPQVTVAGADLRLYARTILALARDWQVHVFAYDWRQSFADSGQQLAAFLQQRGLLEQPVRLVAHGTGGLVARWYVQANATQWYAPRDTAQPNQLVMVGTPNAGTYWAVQLLSGTDKLIRWLDKLDLRNSLPAVLRIFNSFPATYEMLPASADPAEAGTELYQRGTWAPLPTRKHLLAKALQLQQQLATAHSLDPATMTAILGCNQPTICRVDLVSPGEFRFRETLSGDGRVAFPDTAPNPPAAAPAAVGTIYQPTDLPTYYVDEAHGNLMRNPLVLKAVHEILRIRRTASLPKRPTITRTLVQRKRYWHRPIGEDMAGTGLELIAERLTNSSSSDTDLADQYQAAEDTLARAAVGEANPTLRLDMLPLTATRTTASHKRVTLRVLLQRDICQVDTELLLVGRYVGAPLTNRLLALDQALKAWISRASDQGLLGGDLGKVFYLPRPREAAIEARLRARALLLLGMGEEGRYTQHDLRFLMGNASFTTASLNIRRVAAVVLGTRGRGGRGSISEEVALLSFLQGVADGLERCYRSNPQETQQLDITLLPRDEVQYQAQLRFLQQLTTATHPAVDGLTIDFREAECRIDPRPAPPAPPAPPSDLPALNRGPRITIEQVDGRYRFTALIDGAVVPVRELDVQPYFPSTLPGRLMEAVMMQEQETYGELMSTLLFPLDFQDYLAEPLTFVLDRSTASLPWEMACFAQMQNRLAAEGRPAGARSSFGRELQLARQFRTMLSPKPGSPPPRNHSLRILIIADPAPEPELQLPGARREGRAVVEMLSVIKAYLNGRPAGRPGLKLDVVERIGEAECDFLEIIALILNGEFDVIHFAGHGVFVPDTPARQGWVFGKDRILTAREIFRGRHVPRLVFANACFSANVRDGAAFAAEELNGQLAGVAEAFFQLGVRNYLGTGWAVNDEQALLFAREFYAQALIGKSADELLPQYQDATPPPPRAAPGGIGDRPATLGRAIAAARNGIYSDGGSTWGAYQHYGQATDYLLNWQ